MSPVVKQSSHSTATLVISGRFDAHQVPQVQQAIDSLLNSGTRYLILDLSDVNFVDSSALAVMVRGMKHCREKSGEFLLCGMRQPVRIIFELTRMDKAFRIFDNEDAALKAVGA